MSVASRPRAHRLRLRDRDVKQVEHTPRPSSVRARSPRPASSRRSPPPAHARVRVTPSTRRNQRRSESEAHAIRDFAIRSRMYETARSKRMRTGVPVLHAHRATRIRRDCAGDPPVPMDNRAAPLGHQRNCCVQSLRSLHSRERRPRPRQYKRGSPSHFATHITPSADACRVHRRRSRRNRTIVPSNAGTCASHYLWRRLYKTGRASITSGATNV